MFSPSELHVNLLLPGQVGFRLALEGAIAAHRAEVVGHAVIFECAAVWLLHIDFHLADRIGRQVRATLK